MKKYFICQTKLYKTYLILPDDWSGISWYVLSWMINMGSIFIRAQNDYSLTKSILGPNQMFINILVTPLRQEEAEPSIEETHEYFMGLAYRQTLLDESTSTIEVLSKNHFTAKYYRTNSRGVQLIKKYCLYVERMEYLITTVLANISKNEGGPNEEKANEKEKIYDNIVKSLYLEVR